MTDPWIQTCVSFGPIPEEIKAFEIFSRILPQAKINILALYIETPNPNVESTSSKHYYSMIENFVIRLNKFLVTDAPKFHAKYFRTLDPKTVDTYERDPSQFGQFTQQKTFLKEKTEEYKDSEWKTVSNQKMNSDNLVNYLEDLTTVSKKKQDTCTMVVYEKRSRIDNFLIADVWVGGKLIVAKENQDSEQYFKRVLQSNHTLRFHGYSYLYENFDLGAVCKHQDNPKEILYRNYWSLKNMEECGCSISFKRLYFHTKYPETAAPGALLTLDLVFQVDGSIELKVSFEFSHIQVSEDDGKIYWFIHLTKHAACYFSPLKSNEYLAFHVKNWRRVPNFLVGAIPDNIDKIYLETKSVLRLTFDKVYYIDKPFFKQYEEKLCKMERFSNIENSLYKFVKYSEMSLKLSTTRIEEAQVPFDMKFLVMVMISKGQIDAYDFPSNFLEKICDINNRESRPDLIKRALEMIALNKSFDKTFTSYEDFKESYQKCFKLVVKLDKIMSAYKSNSVSAISFDANLYNFELQITPSCIYYLYGDLSLPKSIIFHFSQYVDRFLLVKFIDEDLETIKTVRSVIGNLFYSKFIQSINIMKRKYEFFSFNSSQIQNRTFWSFYSDDKIKTEDLLAKIASKTRSNLNVIQNDDEDMTELINRVLDHPAYAYDILDVAKDRINISEISMKELEERNVNSRHIGVIRKYYTYEGYVSGDLLDEISKKFSYGNIPGIVLNANGADLLLIRDPYSNEKRTIRFREHILKNFKTVEVFEIKEILRYRPATLNRHLILLLESFAKAYFKEADKLSMAEDEYRYFVEGMEVVLSQFSIKLGSLETDFYKRMIMRSKFANNVLEQVLSSYADFPSDPFFSSLTESVYSKASKDLYRKMKLHSEFGAYLLGIIDDTGILRPGEIYYDIDNPLKKPSYKENAFPYVLVAKKPYLDITDIAYFIVNDKRHIRNAYKNLQNCIVFSKDDTDFVLPSYQKGLNLKKMNHFLVLWDQHFIPDRFKKPLEEIRPAKIDAMPPESDTSTSFQFERASLRFSEFPEEVSETEDETQSEKFFKYKTKMMNIFGSLIRNPRIKDIQELHLIYADISNSGCRNETAMRLSDCYREFCFRNSLKQLQDDDQVYYLLNLLENSKYLTVPFYYKSIGSSYAFEPKSMLGKIYKVISLQENQKKEIEEKQNEDKKSEKKKNKEKEPGTKIDETLIFEGYEPYIKHGLKALIMYKYDVQKLCFLYGCANESDLFIGFNRKEESLQKEYKPSSFHSEFVNLKDNIRNLTRKYRLLFSKNLDYITINGEKKLNPDKEDDLLRKASAWYLCSMYRFWRDNPNLKKKLLGQEELKPLFIILNKFEIDKIYGLPWLAANELLHKIKIKNFSKSVESSK